MGYPVLNNCCCGCSLRTGSLVVGILLSIGCLSQTISLSIIADGQRNCYGYYDNYYYCDSGDNAALITQAVVSALMLLANILLVVGAIKEKPKLIGQWVSVYTVILIVEAIFAFIITIYLFTYDALSGFYALLICGVALGIVFYFIAVVSSYHKQLLQPLQTHGRHPQFVGQVYVQQPGVQYPQGQVYPQYQPQSQMTGPPPQYAPQMPGQTYPPTQGPMYPHTPGQAYQQHPAQYVHPQPPKY